MVRHVIGMALSNARPPTELQAGGSTGISMGFYAVTIVVVPMRLHITWPMVFQAVFPACSPAFGDIGSRVGLLLGSHIECMACLEALPCTGCMAGLPTLFLTSLSIGRPTGDMASLMA